MLRDLLILMTLAQLLGSPALAQTEKATSEPPPPPPETQSAPDSVPSPVPTPTPGAMFFDGDLRLRMETWDWFDPGPAYQDDYTYGHARLRARLGYRIPNYLETLVEVQGVQIINAPNAIGPGGIGQMGVGGIVYGHTNQASINTVGIRQAYLKAGNLNSMQFQAGRFLYSSAGEVMPQDKTLAALKNMRLKDRLIGPFDFSPYARSFDGVRVDGDTGDLHLTGFVARPTQGGFEPRFFTEMDKVLISDVAVTVKNGELLPQGEAQAFWTHYSDNRNVPQVDNRPAALRGRIASTGGNNFDTVGFHMMQKLGDFDLLAWYAHQTGSWGTQVHDADAYSLELGYQFDADWKPWLRAGYSYYSGDDNPFDNRHTTFNPMLPTIRIYALTPFYTESNLKDLFGQLILKPTDSTSARLDVHFLDLATPRDLWYAGGGATQNQGNINGFAGRPSGGHTGLGTLVDVGVDHSFNDQYKLGAYFGHIFGGPVIRTSYPANPDGNFFYLEFNLKFP